MKRMKSKFRKYALRFFFWTVIISLVLIGILILLYWQTDVVSRSVETYLNHALDNRGSIRYSRLEGSLINRLRISDLRIELDKTLYLEARYIELHYRLLPLLKNRIEISRVEMDSLRITLETASESAAPDRTSKAFNLDSTLKSLENATVLDSLLAGLPHIELKDLEILTGDLTVTGKNALVLSDMYLRLNLFIKKTGIEFRLLKSSFTFADYDLPLKDFSFQLIGSRQQFTVNQFQMRTPGSEILFSGDVIVSDSLQMLLSLDRLYLDVAELNRVFQQSGLNSGFVSGTALISGTPRYFNTQVSISAEIPDYSANSLHLDADYDYGLVKVHSLALNQGKSKITFRGVVNQATLATNGFLMFKRVDLARLPGLNLPSDINGRLDFKSNSLNLKRLTAAGELVLYDTIIDTIRLDSLRFAIRAHKGNIEISQPSFIKFMDRAKFLLAGTMDREGLIDFTIGAESGDLGALTRAFALDSIHGNYDMQLRATGYMTDPDVSGYVWIRDFTYDEFDFDSIALEMDVHRLLSAREGYTKLFVDSGYVSGMPVSDIRAHAELDSHIVNVSQLGFRSRQNYLSSSLRAEFLQDTIRIAMDYFRFLYENYFMENDGTLSVTIDSNQISLEHLRFKGPNKSAIEVMGFWDFRDEDLQLALTLDSLALKPFEPFLGGRYTFSGTVDGSVEVITPLKDPLVDVDLQASDLEFENVRLGNIKSILGLANRKVVIREFELKERETRLDVSGDLAVSLSGDRYDQFTLLEQTSANLKIRWENVNLANYAPMLKIKESLKGSVSGYLEAEGTVNEPFLRQSLRLNDFTYGDFEVDSLVMFGQYNSGYLIVDSLSGILNATSFALKGWQRFDLKLDSFDSTFTSKPFEFYLKSKDDAIKFIGLFNEQLESINGRYDMELFLTGTPEKPAVNSGYFRMKNGEILLSRVREPIRDVTFDVRIDDSVLTINQFTGYSKQKKKFIDRMLGFFRRGLAFIKRQSIEDGYMSASGTVNLADITRPRMNIDLELQTLFIDYFIESTSLVLTSKNLTITGQDTLKIAGDITVPEGRYELDLSQMQKNIYLTAPVTELTPPYLTMNTNILIPGNFVITSSPLDLANNFKIVIEGELDVKMEPESTDPKIYGHLNTVSGKYASWNQNFEVETGSIVFTNPEVINPDIELIAEKKISKYRVQLVVGGNLENQSYTINVLDKDGRDVPMSMPEKLALLTLGTDLSAITAKSDSTLRSVGEDVASTSVYTAVERGAETFTGLDKVEITSDDKLLDLQKMKLNNGLKDASISFGKYLTSDLYIEYRTNFGNLGNGIPAPRLAWDAGNRLGLEYRINRQWSVDSFYEKTLRGSKMKIGLSWEYTF